MLSRRGGGFSGNGTRGGGERGGLLGGFGDSKVAAGTIGWGRGRCCSLELRDSVAMGTRGGRRVLSN